MSRLTASTRRLSRPMAAAALALAAGSAYSQCNPTLVAPPGITYPEGVNGNVLCSVVWDPDGSGPGSPCLVVGGSFDTANVGGFNHIAMWDGSGWKPLHIGVNGDVKALTVDTSNNTLIAGGSFTTAGIVSASKIARFSAASGLWSAIGSGVTSAGDVNALAYDGLHSQIYLGGSFTAAGGVSTGALARITSTTYSAVGAFFTGTINALFYYDGEATLHVGGIFTDPTLGNAANLIRFNTLTSAWSGMNGGLPGGGVYAITVYAEDGLNPRIVAGGSFGSIGGTQFNSVARWTGSAWAPLSTGVAGTVRGLGVMGNDLYAVGGFVLTGQASIANRSAKWNGSSWSGMGDGLDASGYTATKYKEAMYVGGPFTHVSNGSGNLAASHISMWDGARWSALKGAPSGPVRCMYSLGSSLLIGGAFDMYVGNGTFAHNLVSYNGSQFSAGVGIQGFNGTNGPINSIMFKSNGITIGSTTVAGAFTTAGAVNASNIASYQFAGEFSQVGSGVNGEVFSVANYGSTSGPVPLIGTVATGNFTASGATPTSYICRFGPGAVSLNMGTGLNAPGRALLNYNGKLLVGGFFTTAGGVITGHLAQWDGTNWTTFNGSIVNDSIYTMTLFNGNPVIGGDFTAINGSPARKVAMWNGTSWVDMGAGIDTSVGSVTALAAHNGELYCGGYFATINGQPATFARWNGFSWVPAGGEVTPPPWGVGALASFNGALMVGGGFARAGSAYAPNLAEYKCACYANCDNSTGSPVLTPNDFQCFLDNYVAGTSYANCDGVGGLTGNDFQCYINKYVAGCN